jgi:hypothetical protein
MFGVSELWWMVLAICASIITAGGIIAGSVTRHQFAMLDRVCYRLSRIHQAIESLSRTSDDDEDDDLEGA